MRVGLMGRCYSVFLRNVSTVISDSTPMRIDLLQIIVFDLIVVLSGTSLRSSE